MSSATIVQVTNISPQANKQQMTELFSYLGDISDIKLFPEDDTKSVPSKVCFVNFSELDSVSTALHLTNTIFVDRALVITRSKYDSIPGEDDAMSLAAPAVAVANQNKTIGHTAPLLPTPPVITQAGTNSGAGLAGIAPGIPLPTAAATPPVLPTSMNFTPPTLPSQPLISMMGTVVPTAPPLTGNVDPSKIEEIRRTVYVGNLNSSQITADQVLNFFLPCGEIKYVRMAGDETQPTRFVFVEFAKPESVPIALQYNGAMFGDRPVKVNHSKNAIVKPQGPSAQETQREVDEAMRKVKEAMAAVTATITEKSKSRSRSRSRSKSLDRRSKHVSPAKDRYRRRSRSRSPFYSRRGGGSRRNYSRSPRRRSRSPRRRRSRSPVRRRSRSPARRRSRTPPRRRSRTPPRRRSRTPPRKRSRTPPRKRSRTPPRRRSRTPPRRRSRTPPRMRSRTPPRRRSRSPPRSLSKRGRSRSPPSRYTHRSRSTSREDRRRKRKLSKDRKRRHSLSKSPTPKRSSRKKDRRHRSRSPALLSDDDERPRSRSKKKKHRHHRHKNHSPSPLGLSPSPTPSPAPKLASGEDNKSSAGSEGSPASVKSGMSVDGSPRGKRRVDVASGQRDSRSSSSVDEERESRGSSTAKEEGGDSDSSYD